MPTLGSRIEKNKSLSQKKTEKSWRDWLKNKFKSATLFDPSPRHIRLWEWFEKLEPDSNTLPKGEYWPRGGAKSSTAELATTRLGCRLKKTFVLYVSGTQKQANKHVQSIATNFESLGYERALTAYGDSKGWRVDLLRVDNGFNVLALGLDSAARGIKLDSFRPDLIILDDIDDRHDKPETVKKKIETITESILPSGSIYCDILFIQNLIHKGSIATQLENNTADFLLNRETSKAEPAVKDLKIQNYQRENGITAYRIIEGTATWEGQDLKTCEKQLNDIGRASFMREMQHLVETVEDGLWNRQRDVEPFKYRQREDNQIEFQTQSGWQLIKPKFIRIGVAIDPSWATKGDVAGIVSGAIFKHNNHIHGVVFNDKSLRGSASKWAETAVNEYHNLKADVLLGEGNFMGEVVKSTISTIEGAPPVKLIHVSRGKLIRAEPVQKLSEDGRLHFPSTGTEDLITECCTYKAGDESPGRMDALVILFSELMLSTQKATMNAEEANAFFN